MTLRSEIQLDQGKSRGVLKKGAPFFCDGKRRKALREIENRITMSATGGGRL
jgi:hypothetical protein